MPKSNINIISVYEFTTTEMKQAYIFTTTNSENPVGYHYYILDEDSEGKSQISIIKNPIELINNSNVKLHKINKNSPTYDNFISLLAFVIKVEEDKQLQNSDLNMSLKPQK